MLLLPSLSCLYKRIDYEVSHDEPRIWEDELGTYNLHDVTR